MKSKIFIILFLFIVQISFGQNYARLVNPEIGTEGEGLECGYTYLGACYPFGMVQLTPSFFSPQKGFVINQLSGAGCAHMGNFPVLPLEGSIMASPKDMEAFPKYKTVNEAFAGYLSVEMEDETQAELTVTRRSGIARFLFREGVEEGSVLIGSGVSSTFVHNAMIRITSDYSCEGFAEGGEFCGTPTNYKVYFVAEFDRPAQQTGTWLGDALLDSVNMVFGKNSGAYFTFDTKACNEVNYQIAISYVSIENARANLEAGKCFSHFDEYQSACERVWNDNLCKIKVESANQNRLVQLYTHFYHSLIHPNIVSDITGEYMGADFEVHQTKHRDYYSSFSVWDTYRTQAQLLAMLYPTEVSDMMQSLVEFAEQSGGYGRWILANIETGIMQGDPTPILIANSYAFGARNFDVAKAFQWMNRGATIPLLRSQDQEIRPYLTEYIRYGIAPASMMLEYNSSDYAIGQFALQALNDTKNARFFMKRSLLWKNLYNTGNKWLNSRSVNGEWKDIGDDWREATYKNYFWMVPHDLETLIDTIGGRKLAEKRLDTLFTKLDASYDDDWFAAGNEPDLQVPWIYNWTDSPYKSSLVIHRIFDTMYDNAKTGLPGNDDLGTLGSWYVLASIGLYPMIPGVGGFSLSAPQFEKVDITLPEGNLFITSDEIHQPYIHSVKMNNIRINGAWIKWNLLRKGGMLHFKTSSEFEESWFDRNKKDKVDL